MNKENLLSFKAHVDKKDLEIFSQALMEQVVKLQVENQQLKEKVEHLEMLLKNVPMDKNEYGIIVGDVTVEQYDKESFFDKYEK